ITAVTTNNLKDITGKTTTIGLLMQTSWFSKGNQGPVTGSNSGVFPDPVLKDYYFFGSQGGPQTVTSKITNLDTGKLYNISFLASSNWSGTPNNGNTVFAIGSASIPLSVQNNTTNTADFSSVKPAGDGSITFTMSKGSGATSGYINAIVLKSLYTDSAKPVKPAYLAAQIFGKGVKLTWNDNAYNETSYKVFRALNLAGPFTIINSSLPFNSTSYLDTTTAGSTRYYYFVKAFNTESSDSSNIVSVTTTDKIPVISPIANVIIKNNQQQTIHVTSSDDATDQIILTAVNLPSFITFTDNGNGTGSFSIVPTSGVTGIFENITVIATDLSDSSSSASFNVTITDQNINSVYVNFSNGTLASSPWNNFTLFPNANALLSNLTDDNNTGTAISLKIMNSFQGNFAGGMQPGNNKGVYPEVVMRTGIYEGAAKTDSMQISGLAKNKKYNFVFFNSHDDGLKGNTNFTINGQTVSINATHNINTTAQINGILADANGQVMIKVAKASGADYAYLNSLVIQSFDSAQKLLAPSDLRVVNTTRNAVSLQWADRSFDETGFEIWRASDTTNSSYTLLATVAPNAIKYVDSNLPSAHTYYYTIRSISAGTQSAYCNPVAATTYSQAVFINFTFISNANVPWNNTLALPQPGLQWDNFMDDTGIPSSIGMKETGMFAGIYGPGMNTGNNSGLYPDKVLADNYGLFPGESATIKVTGLNLNVKYDFTFFASSQINGDVNTSYTVNGKKVILNAATNTNGTVTMFGIVPDENGEALITISPNTTTSQYGLIGALVVQEYKPSTRTILSLPSFNKKAIATGNNKNEYLKQPVLNNRNKTAVYPNPFHNSFTLSLCSVRDDNAKIELYTMTGKLLLRKDLGYILPGSHTCNINIDKNITPGVYLLKIIYVKSKVTECKEILKQ
ncbi:MAG: T9SS type A sorting domain-containing protein, partial [Parafilimonas sp.]